MITVRVPATSANMGPGFDSIGIALNLYNTFYMEVATPLRFPRRMANMCRAMRAI